MVTMSPMMRYGVAVRALFVFCAFVIWLQLMMYLKSDAPGRPEEDGVNSVYDTSYIMLETVPAHHNVEDDVNSVYETSRVLETVPAHLQDDVISAHETSHPVLKTTPAHLRQNSTISAQNLSTTSSTTEAQSRNTSEILREITRYNEAQTVLNLDLYGPVREDTVIIAVQVHTRLTYLRHLISSLAQVRGIEKILLIFSHDYFDDAINNVIQSIKFCMVLQIFYPFSIQTHPHEFPGEDPNDCPRDAQPDIARKVLKCKNAEWPDVYYHYREAKYTQTKHHWWWKANRIFNQLDITLNHEGLVVFLEEDHYIAKDALHVLSLMRSTAGEVCPKCELFSLGTFVNFGNAHEVDITPWLPSTHIMVMAFNKTLFRSISEHAGYFCLYDDYNWDFSLLYLSQKRGLNRTKRFHVMRSATMRVYHIGECGIHHKKANCNESSTVLNKVQQHLAEVDEELFPERLLLAREIIPTPKLNYQRVVPNGGWGDPRDRELCIKMSKLGRTENKTITFSSGRNTLLHRESLKHLLPQEMP